MNGRNDFPILIAPEEAVKLFTYADTYEMQIAGELSHTYRQYFKAEGDLIWDFFRLLSFVYDTGRVQGIREERAKRKS